MRSKKILVVGSLVLLLGLLAVYLQVQGAARPSQARTSHPESSFTSPYNISNSAAPQYENSQHPRVFWTSDNYLHAAWMEGTDGAYGAAYSRGQGTIWPLWEWTGPHNSTAYANPSIAVDSQGNAHVAWTVMSRSIPTPRYDTYYAQRVGGIWSAPINLTEPLGSNRRSSFYPSIVVDSQDRVWVAWQTTISDTDSDVYVRSKPAGGDFGPLTLLSNSTSDDINVELAVGKNDSIHAVWRTRIGSQFDILYCRYDGGTWSTPLNISGTGSQSYYPQVAADGVGNVFVAWSDEYGGSDSFDILFRRYDGTNWLSLQFASNSPKALYPGLGADGCLLYSVWTDYRDNPSKPEVYFSYSTDCGTTWIGDENVSRNGSSSFWPRVDAGAWGEAHILWQDYAPGQWDIYYSKATVLSGPTPTPTQSPTNTPTPILTPQGYLPILARNLPVTQAPSPTPSPTPVPTFPPVASFTSTAPVCDGTAVAFTNTSYLGYPEATTFLWTFGDGHMSALKSPTHLYAGPGAYTVSMQLCNIVGCDAVTATVAVLPLPQAYFTFTTDLLTVTFSNGSQGAASYLWNLGDGITSTLESPVHTYATTGTYTVTLWATGECGTDEFSSTLYVSPLPRASFTSNSPVCLGAEAVFTNTSTGADSYLWTLGDGATSTETHPLHTYTETGSFTVTLEACNAAGCSAAAAPFVVLAPPVAGFTYSADLLTVAFTNTSTGADSYLWDLGDGITSTLPNPEHTYAGAGTYTVTLWATGECGTDEFSSTVAVSITQPPIVVYFAPDYPCKEAGADRPIRVLARVQDSALQPVGDAVVTVQIGGDIWALVWVSSDAHWGYYGAGGTCWNSAEASPPRVYSLDQDVILVAVRGLSTDTRTANTAGQPPCSECP